MHCRGGRSGWWRIGGELVARLGQGESVCCRVVRWGAYSQANDQSGYIGAAIVGVFAAILLGYHLGKWGVRRYRERKGRVVLAE